ncbi:ribonuclease III [Chondromyces crocatus]|uniref:Ribonuclease 3 n=1 Tax=Chondromyces crocatus TaxID=52 RepID=A0A0K1ENR2_CHOCO|nr:ribonuclease III [Chondromyces crocatus]AKT42287.1 ribonuclease III [Chondromyces crocatus]
MEGSALPGELGQLPELEGELPHLEEALTHASFANEQRGVRRLDNQRLEFLGDAVLGLCVTEILMARFPEAREGELSLMRAALVNTDALATWARAVDLGAALRLGRGADVAGERDQTNVLADATEALVAAVYLDRGLDVARALSRRITAEPIGRLQGGGRIGRDPKSQLQERIQARGGPSPRYRIVGVEGPDHERVFTAVAEADGEVLGQGRGRSKKLAEQAAARAALEGLGVLPAESNGGGEAFVQAEAGAAVADGEGGRPARTVGNVR